MRCTTCNKALTEATRATHPFCSARCRQVDLGRWLNNEYRIGGTEQEGTEIDLEAPVRHREDEK